MSGNLKNDWFLKRCKVAVKTYKALHEEGLIEAGVHSRLLDILVTHHCEPFAYDSQFKNDVDAILKNKRARGKWHFEHAVPLKLIHKILSDEGIINLEEQKLAKLLQSWLRVVVIPTELQKKLDGPLRLKTSMPEGWDPKTDDPMARIKLVYNNYPEGLVFVG